MPNRLSLSPLLLTAFLLAGVGAAVCAAETQPAERPAAGQAPLDLVKQRLGPNAPLKVRWALDLGQQSVSKIWLPPAELGAENLLALTDQNELLSIRRRSGTTEWSTRLEAPITGEPFFTEFAVYFVMQSHLVSLERHSGETIYRVNLPFPPLTGPAVVEEAEGTPTAYVPGLDKKLYAVEVESVTWPPKGGAGAIRREDFSYQKPVVRIVWRYPSYGGIGGGVSISDRKVFMADASNYVYGIITTDLSFGKPDEVQIFRTQGAMSVGPTAIGSYVLVPSRDHNLYCLDRRSLSEVWRYPSGHILEDEAYALVDPNTNQTLVICKCGKQGPLTGLNDIDGKVQWELPEALGVVSRQFDPDAVAADRTIMVVANRDNTLTGHRALTGERLWSMPAKSFLLYPKNTIDEFVYSTTDGGRILFALSPPE